jgi:hypothetical protein
MRDGFAKLAAAYLFSRYDSVPNDQVGVPAEVNGIQVRERAEYLLRCNGSVEPLPQTRLAAAPGRATKERQMTFLKILALALTALILVPSAAHLFEMPGKMDLDRDAYFTVQGIYAGWALFGVPIIAAVLANGVLFVALRRNNPAAARWALASAALIAASLAIFFTWTFPANQATANWTAMPENWEALRLEWEASHAVNALVIFAAFLSTAMAAVGR